MRLIVNILLLVLFSAVYTVGQCKTETCGLVVRGNVTELNIDKSNKDYVLFHVKLAMEFKNESIEPIILFKPNTDNSYFEGAYYLGAKSLSENESGKALHIEAAWESVIGSPFYKRLSEHLDTKTPPAEFTKILQPNEIWSFPDKTLIIFTYEKDRYNEGRQKSWEEMKSRPSKLWLQINYELSPWNAEFFKPDLLRKLAKRWKTVGNVVIEPKKDGRFNHFTIGSKPMPIDFSQAKERATSSGR